MEKLARTRVTGPLAEFADGFRAELATQGYTPGSADHLVRAMASLSRWLTTEGLAVHEVDETQLERFVDAWRASGRSAAARASTRRR